MNKVTCFIAIVGIEPATIQNLRKLETLLSVTIDSAC
jgi:hypothetical protein